MAITDVWESLKMLGVEMGAKSAPLIQELADKVLDYIKAAREWVAANGGIRDSAKAMWAELKNLWTQGKDFLAGVWDEVTAKANGVWIDVRAEAEKAWLTIKSVASSALKSITEFAADVRNGLEEWKGPLLEIRDMLKEVMGFAKMLAGHIGDVNTALDKINNFNPSWLVIRGAGNLLGVGPNPVFPKAAAGNLPAGGGGLARPLPMKPAGAAGMLDDPLLNHKLAMIDGMKNIDKAKLGPAPAGGGWGNFANKAKGVIGGFIGNIRDAAAKGVAGAKANANNAPDKKKADDLHNNAGAGIGSAIHNLRGIGAHDVRTVEGFSEAARGLQQQQAYALAQREFIETRRIREALEKLGLVG
jgi:hypothetical protein